MKNITVIKYSNDTSLISSMLFLIFGIILFTNPSGILNFISYIAGGILCIIGIHNLNRRTQASLISAYALLDNTYKEYKKKIQEEYPDDSKVVDFEHEIIKSKFDKNMELDKDKQLFFDYQSMRYFESTLKEVKEAEQHLNDCLAEDGYVCLNEMYDFLELPKTPYGWQLGWSYIYSDTIYSEDDIKLRFEYEPITMDDGLECTIITIKYPKSLEYLC